MLLSAPARRRTWASTLECQLLRRAGLALSLSVAAAARRAWSKTPSTNWPSAGGRSSTPSTRRRAMSASSCTRARTCSTAPPSRCSSSASTSHPRCCINYDPSHFVLQQLDYLEFIDIYHERIKAFHVKDAEFGPDGRQGVYAGYQPWVDRAGRFRSLGDGQVDFKAHLLEAGAVRLRRLGGARVGVLPEASRAGRARKARRSSRSHHPGDREGVRRLRRRARTAQLKRMLGL